METKRMMILGATGSVGMQAVDVAEKYNCEVTGISAGTSVAQTEALARKFGVPFCAMADEAAAADLKTRLADTNTRVLSGAEGICEMVGSVQCDLVLNSIIGEAGLLPTLAALDSGTTLALANKESLVVAGDIVMQRAKEKNVNILPVDSEHCAIFQCLHTGQTKEVKKILLTASGGPFFGYSKEQLHRITRAQALAHPTWKMGAKITIDSATLMNKGFEVIEAVHLFGVSVDHIEVVVHRESIIHSMVEYIDNSIIAQLSVPDMRHCVQHALTYPARTEAVIPELNLFDVAKLSFAKPDEETFVLLACAKDAIRRGGALPAVVNAANEVAVAAFLQEKLSFDGIMEVVCAVKDSLQSAQNVHTLEEILSYDREARVAAQELCLRYLRHA